MILLESEQWIDVEKQEVERENSSPSQSRAQMVEGAMHLSDSGGLV